MNSSPMDKFFSHVPWPPHDPVDPDMLTRQAKDLASTHRDNFWAVALWQVATLLELERAKRMTSVDAAEGAVERP